MTNESDPGLDELGLAVGQSVRFRRRSGERWKDAIVVQRERDGSVGLIDGKGAARAIPIDRLEIRTPGRRAGGGWEPLIDQLTRGSQLSLSFDDGSRPPRSTRRRND